MRQHRWALGACLALVLFLGMVGCSDQTEEARKLADQANVLAEEYNGLDARYLQMWNQLWGTWHGVGTPDLEGPEAVREIGGRS